ncbi:MAG: hypothetical protein AAF682_20810 [Planctomycetota bacterium]
MFRSLCSLVMRAFAVALMVSGGWMMFVGSAVAADGDIFEVPAEGKECCRQGVIFLPEDACGGCAKDPITCAGTACEDTENGDCKKGEGSCKMSDNGEVVSVKCYKCTTPTIPCGVGKSRCKKESTNDSAKIITYCSGTLCS